MTDNIFKGFDQLWELAKTLEEKIEQGEIKTSVQINNLRSIPRQGNMPRNSGNSAPFNPTVKSKVSENNPIITPPPSSHGNEKNESKLTDVGGLNDIIQELRELVEIPLKRPDLLGKLGLEPTRGVLLVGPPGTGKTMTARALAEDLGVNYIAIVGPEIMSKYYGESEGRLRQIFEQAIRSKPCIIFIDEIDTLAPDRSKVEGEVEKRLVGQLLGLMDGFVNATGLIVLAATNRPNHLDPALRRPGRFDREIVFRVPDRKARLDIIRILTRSIPLEPSVNLEEIVDHAQGFVGADLKALCQKAAYHALRRQLPNLDSPIPENMTVNATDFAQAIQEIKPSILRSLEIETPQISWDEIGGLTKIKATLKEAVEGQLLYPELYHKTKAKAPRGILLWGPPGTGKTLLAKAVASQANANFISVTGAELISRWVGASEQAVKELFTKARQSEPCVIFIDEIDTLAPARGSNLGDSGISDRVVGQLLTELDGLQISHNILLIVATNRPDALDPALLRSGRLDLQLKIDLPDHDSRLGILQVHNLDRPLVGVDLAYFATKTEGWNGADLALLSNQAAIQAIHRYRANGLTEPGQIKISHHDFSNAYDILQAQKK